MVAGGVVGVAAGDEETATFEVVAPDTPGDFDLMIQMQDGEMTVPFTVEEPDNSDNGAFDDNPDGSSSPDEQADGVRDDSTDDSVPGFGVGVAVVGLIVSVFVVARLPR